MLEYIRRELLTWLSSPQRAEQAAAVRYLAGRHDILNRKRTVIGRDGRLEAADNLPNNRLVDNQYGRLVRQKVNYLVGRPFSFVSLGDGIESSGQPEGKNSGLPEGKNSGRPGTAAPTDVLNRFFTKYHRKVIRDVCEDAVNTGIGWLMPHFDSDGAMRFKRIPPYELLPFWADSDHTTLDCAVRCYCSAVCAVSGLPDRHGTAPVREKTVWRVEIYTKNGISRFVLDKDKLIPDDTLPSGPWLTAGGQAWSWRRVPLIPFKAPREESLLSRVKSLQDALNTLISDYQNSLQEDARNTILVLKNYDGTDLAEFRHNLAAFGAVKVKTVDNTPGGVETLRVDVNHQSYEALAATLKRAIVENGMGFDTRILHGTPNQMTLMSMYSDIELDAHALETEWKSSFDVLLGFVWAGCSLASQTAETGNSLARSAVAREMRRERGMPLSGVEVVFNRDMLLNESDIMKTLLAAGLKISNRSLLEQVPWVLDAETELERLRLENSPPLAGD